MVVWRMWRVSKLLGSIVPLVAVSAALLLGCFASATQTIAARSASFQDSHIAPENGNGKGHLQANYNPYFAQNLPLYIQATTDVALNMTIKVADFNNDSVNVTWDWGDGSPNGTNMTAPALSPQWVNQTHTWSVPKLPGAGDYYVLYYLNITLDDGMGGMAKTTRYAYVYVPPNGIPSIEMSAPQKVDPTDNVTIVANATDPEGDPLTWTFVVNNSVIDVYTVVYHTLASAPNETVWQNLSYTFGSEGVYTVRLNVSDALPPFDNWPHNISTTIMIQVVVNQPPIVGPIQSNPGSPLLLYESVGHVYVNLSVLCADLDGDVITASWDFGDQSPIVTNVTAGGVVVYTLVQNHSYTTSGSFNVTVTFSDGHSGGNATGYLVLTIIAVGIPPVADAGPDQSVPSGTLVYLDGRGSSDNVGIVNFTWTFIYDGNLVVLYGAMPSFLFVLEGVYQVTLNVSDAVGLYNSSTVTITVGPAIPEFTSIMVPVLSILVLLLALSAVRTRKRCD